MTDQLPDQLRGVFTATATEADVPPLPWAAVETAGRRLQAVRRRRAALWTAAAAAVAVVAVALPLAAAQHADHHAPAPAHRTMKPAPSASGDLVAALPLGMSANVAMVRDGRLTMGRVIAVGVKRVAQAGATLLVSHLDPKTGLTVDAVVATGPGGRVAALGDPGGDGLGGPVLSPDGTTAVGARHDGSGVTLTEWSLSAGAVVGTVHVPGADDKTLRLDAVDDHGLAYVTTFAPRAGFTWQPGGSPQLMTGVTADLWSAGFTVVGPDGVVDPPGCDDQPLAVAPDGSTVLCHGPAHSGLVFAPAGGTERVPVRLPVKPLDVVGFDSDGSALLTARDGESVWLVRCTAADGACERVSPVPTGATFPEPLTGAAMAPGTPPAVPTTAPSIPYARDGVLHVGRTALGSGITGAVTSGGTVLAMQEGAPNAAGGSTIHVSLVDGDRLLPVPALTSVGLDNHSDAYAPHLSTDGRVAVAMSWRDGTTLRMTAWSVAQRRVLGTVDLPDQMIAAEHIVGVQADGSIVYGDSTARAGFTWRPGSKPVRLPKQLSDEVLKGEVMVTPAGIEPLPHGFLLPSPDGSRFLGTNYHGTAYIASVETGYRVVLDLPDSLYGVVGFESADDVLLTAGDAQGGPLVRCDTTTGACTQVWASTAGVTFAVTGDW